MDGEAEEQGCSVTRLPEASFPLSKRETKHAGVTEENSGSCAVISFREPSPNLYSHMDQVGDTYR